jgi:hypothetical protein
LPSAPAAAAAAAAAAGEGVKERERERERERDQGGAAVGRGHGLTSPQLRMRSSGPAASEVPEGPGGREIFSPPQQAPPQPQPQLLQQHQLQLQLQGSGEEAGIRVASVSLDASGDEA